ncbi:GntR family transcriptional regulator [Acidicapsa dinghuensis]|uniref:GntR family transcriptional regulator n=1 Tax=Acidicapsa dinghuensis TaxID=2218256 RepID=A0ABW1EJR3_9BACT|nr:FCD domain-containing protein [Acidicapsa dinghuensis]
MTQGAYESLRADLLACRILPGNRLKIQDLCTRFSVSLGAVREALSRLTSEGLVIAEPQRGFRAAPISAADLTDLTMVRVEIETLCLRRAIAFGDVDWEARLVAAAHRLSRTPERDTNDPARSNEDWAEAHSAFHLALVDGCESPWLLHLHALLYAQSERYRRLSVPFAAKGRNVDEEHQAIVTATLARDAENATRLLAAHLEATTHILLNATVDGRKLLDDTQDSDSLNAVHGRNLRPSIQASHHRARLHVSTEAC